MKAFRVWVLFMTTALVFTQCNTNVAKRFSVNNSKIIYSGRVEKLGEEVVLIGSAASATAYFTGDTCVLYVKNNNSNGLHNFYSVELDKEDLGRFRITGDTTVAIPIEIRFEREVHSIVLTKSTEAANGYINFQGIYCDNLETPPPPAMKSIEFIGNSITCGMGNDTLMIPCHTNQWYDQHNAYWAYGPTVSRALKVEYLLSSVSGIGIYRNWNGVGPTMPEVYENLYLNLNEEKKRDFTTFNPTIVSICLGTNDFSDGDGKNERLPFSAETFTNTYIDFVQTILNHYPETQIALLNSPMVKGEKNELFLECLNNVKKHFEGTEYKPFAIFTFEEIIPHGCDYHPDINDHMTMADQLFPFYSQLLEE
ncbi:MAG: GDSL-type esterase/lipase family protein [Prolixibacteraceae bacterium]